MTRPYLIHTEQRAILVAEDERVPAAIASARPLEYNGKRLYGVPYNTWETQVLRTLDYMVPSPIGTYYDWPRDISLAPEPFYNQIETAAFLTLNHRAYCLNEIGTGKTNSALWATDWLMRERLIRKVVIVSPLSTLERVWGDGVFVHQRMRNLAVLHGTAARRRKLFSNDRFDYYVINHDALDIISELRYGVVRGQKKLLEGRLLRDDIDLIIIDELGAYRNQGTDRWRMLNKVLKPAMWGWGLTGTPIPNAPSDAYAEIKLLTPDRVPLYYSQFRQETMQQLTEYIWVPRKESIEIVYKAMQPAIRFTRDECFDLPPATYSTRKVELTTEQKLHYKAVSKELYTEIQGGKITAVNEGVKASKLIQIVCGVVYDNKGVERSIDARPRIAEVEQIIEQCEHKVIVFVPFTAPLKSLAKHLEKKFSTAVVYGDVSKAKRDAIFAEFQNLRDPKVLLADAGCMSHGLTLTEASTIVWYGPEQSNDIYTQANGRITRPGQRNNQHIIHIMSTQAENRIYSRLQSRGATQASLLDMVQEGMNL